MINAGDLVMVLHGEHAKSIGRAVNHYSIPVTFKSNGNKTKIIEFWEVHFDHPKTIRLNHDGSRVVSSKFAITMNNLCKVAGDEAKTVDSGDGENE